MTHEAFERMQRLNIFKSMCFEGSAMYNCTFENDKGINPVMSKAKIYVDKWNEMYSKNIGCLLWGDVGTGKTFFAACIANALIEKGVSVKMTNFASILNDLFSEAHKNEYIERLNNHNLLIIDDLGMERNTEYALEQVYNVIDSRYRTKKPLIVTTNLSITEIKDTTDTAHKRIYDRILEMCIPIKFDGESIRRTIAKDKRIYIKNIFEEASQ